MSDLDVSGIDRFAIARAARLLEAGKLVAFPSETVYGLGADAENPQAVADIYAAKGRPADHPVIVHVAPQADIAYWARDIPQAAHQLMAAFWPGPLTLILLRAAGIDPIVSGGQESVGLRCPSHPVAQALLREFKGGKGGIAGPSANKFGHVSPTTAQHVRDEFGDDGWIDEILEGGQSEVGIESTIIDLSRYASHGPVLLRPGHISAAQIEAVLGVTVQMPDAAAPRASGTLDAHYAPHTPMAMVAGAEIASVAVRLGKAGKKMAIMHITPLACASHASIALPSEAAAYAHDLYASLRAMDQVGADLILLEAAPAGAAWQGINDRLRRACHDSAGVLERLLATA